MKIGILDSGVGGLSVLREIRKRLPQLDLHYVGDSAWCPYGTKSPAEICGRVGKIVDYLLNCQVSLIVIACNSATIHAVEWCRSIYPVPFVGMEPAVKPASEATRSRVIGVLATEASIAGEKFLRLVDTTAKGVNVITQPCPKFVEFVEKGIFSGTAVDEAIHEYLDHLIEKGADVLVLGCTHYPFLLDSIQKIVPREVKIIDTGEAVARRVESLLQETGGSGSMRIETSGNLAEMEAVIPRLIGRLEGIELGRVRF
jgi:glutamate racemase